MLNRVRSQLLLIASLFLVSSASAQLQKGNGILSGNVSIIYNQSRMPGTTLPYPPPVDVQTTVNPTVALTAGRFWTDNWLAGLSVSGINTHIRQHERNSNQGYSTNQLSVFATPFVRRYWPVGSVYLFAGAGLSVGVSNSKQPSPDGNGQLIDKGQRSSSINVSPHIEAGVNYFLTNRLGLQLVATANSLPLTTAGLNAGLVYWTGSNRRADQQEERSNAQTDPGRWVIEGSFSVISQKNEQMANSLGITTYESTGKNYSFNPSVGFFVKKNSLIGVSIPITYYANQYTNNGTLSTSDATWLVGISPYYQHYWTATRLTPYTRANVGYTQYNTKPSTGNAVNGGLTVGLAYMAGQRFIIETSLASASVVYLAINGSDTSTAIKQWNVNLSAGLTGNFAIRYIL